MVKMYVFRDLQQTEVQDVIQGFGQSVRPSKLRLGWVRVRLVLELGLGLVLGLGLRLGLVRLSDTRYIGLLNAYGQIV